MSGPPGELPPVRTAPNDLWSGLPPQGAVTDRPLTYGEKELLKVYVRFREEAPSQRWLLQRGVANGLIMATLFGVFVGVVYAVSALVSGIDSEPSAGDPADHSWNRLIALTIWLGLTLGFLVRDQIDLRQTVAVWHLVRRAVKHPTIDRLLQSGTLSTDGDPAVAKEMSS